MPINPQQRLWQRRFESVISLAAPALDLLLAGGDRASRILSPGQDDYYPIRPPGEPFELDEPGEERRRRTAPVD